MKLIKYIDKKHYGNQGRTAIFGIYECPVCKKHFEVRTDNVKSGSSTKCKSCSSSIKNTTHGLGNHRIYNVWFAMVDRCTHQKNKAFINYGGRGITVCDRWLNVENFIEDMYPTYAEGLSIDRINNDGNYEPSNCRWSNKLIQNQNTRLIRSTNTSGFRGASFESRNNKFQSQIRVNKKMIFLGYFNTAIEAGYAYDKYVIDNNLEHTTNGLYTTF